MNNILEINSVTYKPDDNSFLQMNKEVILKNISFTLKKGKILGIAGESGSGKTTLAKLIAGIYTPSEGNIIIKSSEKWNNISASPVQILFQNTGNIVNPLRIVYEAVLETIRLRNEHRQDTETEAQRIFSLINFPPELWHKKGYQLSGGEQQRAALARIIAAEPELLILDEPFSAQDPESQQNFVNMFKHINEELGISMICISHNLKLLKDFCSEIIIMYKGEIVEQGECTTLFNSPQHPYTKYLLKAENFDLSLDELKFNNNG